VFTEIILRDFRGFTQLELKNLGRLNLVVGRNNSGKTSLLEGIELICDVHRLGDPTSLLRTKPSDGGEQLRRWLVRDGSGAESELHGVCHSQPNAQRKVWLTRLDATAQVREDGSRSVVLNSSRMQASTTPGQTAMRCRPISAEPHDPKSLVQLFDRAMSRREGEEIIEKLLREVDPRVRRIRIRAPSGRDAFIEVDLGLSERIPLSQTGQGMSRLVALFSELLGEAPQVCLVDEIENGIHHTLLPRIWRGLAAAARELDIQVFATTHSHECIVAAHEVFAAQSSYDFRIVQLFRYDGDEPKGVQGRVLDQQLVEAAIRGEIDLR